VAGVGSDDYKEYADILRACASDPSAGLVLISQDAPAGVGPSAIDHYGKITRAATEVFLEKKAPVVLFSNHSTPSCPEIVNDMIDSGVPYLQGTRESLAAVSHLMRYSMDADRERERETLSGTEPLKYPFPWNAIETRMDELSKGKKFLGEKEGKEILSMLGIPVAKQAVCKNEDELLAAAGAIGYPLVMKIESPDIAHKTEAGGVALGLRDAEEVHSAYETMTRTARERCPDARVEGVTLQKMVPDGVDLIIGMHRDPQFGPVMAYGLGGIYVEVFKDSSLGLIPLDCRKASEMVRCSKSYALLKEIRGRAALDERLPVDVMLRVSEFVERFGSRISAIDINPVRLGTFGICVLDALILLSEQ
jgi:acetyltransferase